MTVAAAARVTQKSLNAVRVLYFAAVREKIGLGEETIELTPSLTTLGALRAHLALRHGILAEPAIKGAVNQELAQPGTAIAAGDEIAFFPPTTGG